VHLDGDPHGLHVHIAGVEASLTSTEHFAKLISDIRVYLFEHSDTSVQTVVSSLVWNDTIYRTFNEGLRLAKTRAVKNQLPNSLVDYIHKAHLRNVVMTLRKLYDDKQEGAYSVNSIRTVTQKLLDNAHLFTRQNFVTYDGTPYAAKEGLNWRTRALVDGRHGEFDLLCGCKDIKLRKRSDKVRDIIFKQLHTRTVFRPELDLFASKFLAHSAAAKNRPDEGKAFSDVRLARVQAQCRSMIWSLQTINRLIGQPVLTDVPSASFDVLKNWENGLFNRPIKKQLQRYWYQRAAWWRKWTDTYRDWNTIRLSPGHKGLSRG
jgi:hypothetical protein